MIKIVFKQLWNQRRMNSWIFIELVIVSFFLWTVIDPIYVLTANHLIDKGYDGHNRYVVNVGAYDDSNGNYREELDSDSLNRKNYFRLIQVIRDMPEVESFSISTNSSFPNCGSWNGARIYPDTALISKGEYTHVQWYQFVQRDGSDLFRTYGMKDARTGGDIALPVDCGVRRGVFVSAYLAQRLFGTIDVVGKKIYDRNYDGREIVGVFSDYVHQDYEQPYPLLVYVDSDLAETDLNWWYNLVFKLKEGVEADVFEQHFRKDVAPRLSIGNYYFKSLTTFAELSKDYAERSGKASKLRLQYALGGFALLCIFLGMVGTFWIRCNARRQEIGLMRSLGATRAVICRQFLLEAVLMVTSAFALAIPALIHYVHESGVYVVQGAGTPVPNPVYWQNQLVTHFCIVTVISYIILVAIALLGTYIPASRAARILPADALRDE